MPRSDQVAWTEELAERHDEYRATCPAATGTVAIVCVTNRPRFLPSVLACVHHQTWPSRELIVVTNSADYQHAAVEAAVGDADPGCPSRVLHRDEDRSLGSCLNDALEATGARFVAKFDDDDHYGPEYLMDALRAHRYAGAGVVGKHTYYAHLVDDDRTILRFPTHEFAYSATLAGGTLVIDRDRTGDLRFPDISLGEDRGFLQRCHRRGISTFSADRFNFVQSRGADNTWSVPRDEFLKLTTPVSAGLPLDVIDR